MAALRTPAPTRTGRNRRPSSWGRSGTWWAWARTPAGVPASHGVHGPHQRPAARGRQQAGPGDPADAHGSAWRGVTWLTEAPQSWSGSATCEGSRPRWTALPSRRHPAQAGVAYTDAWAAADHHLAIATRAGDQREVSGALHNLGLVAWDAWATRGGAVTVTEIPRCGRRSGDERSRGHVKPATSPP